LIKDTTRLLIDCKKLQMLPRKTWSGRGKNHDFCSNSAACVVKRQVEGGGGTGDRKCVIMMYLYRVIHIEQNPDI
jgi:hypothetical protein